MRPSENLSAYGGVQGQGGRPKMPGRRQANLARSGFLHVENVFSPTTQASDFAAGRNRAGYLDRLLVFMALRTAGEAEIG